MIFCQRDLKERVKERERKAKNTWKIFEMMALNKREREKVGEGVGDKGREVRWKRRKGR